MITSLKKVWNLLKNTQKTLEFRNIIMIGAKTVKKLYIVIFTMKNLLRVTGLPINTVSLSMKNLEGSD